MRAKRGISKFISVNGVRNIYFINLKHQVRYFIKSFGDKKGIIPIISSASMRVLN